MDPDIRPEWVLVMHSAGMWMQLIKIHFTSDWENSRYIYNTCLPHRSTNKVSEQFSSTQEKEEQQTAKIYIFSNKTLPNYEC